MQIQFSYYSDRILREKMLNIQLQLDEKTERYFTEILAKENINSDELLKRLIYQHWLNLQNKDNNLPTEKISGSSPKSKIKKKPRTNLCVTMSNGRKIKNSTAAQTFLEVIAAFGIEEVRKLGMKRSGHKYEIELISTQNHDIYRQQPLGQYYVFTNTSTVDKKKYLEEIASYLGEEIKVEIID